MGFFSFLHSPDIDEGINEYYKSDRAVLLDVRTFQEYQEGHIPNSKNIPLQQIDKINATVPQKDTPIFVYCHSGARSRQATEALQRMGYLCVKNIGGISAYTGKVERV